MTAASTRCDSQRNDESKDYMLAVADIALSGDAMPTLGPENFGEVLDVKFDGEVLVLGILDTASITFSMNAGHRSAYSLVSIGHR